MKTSFLLATCLVLCAGLATPLRRHQLEDPSGLDNFAFPAWTITNFDGGCSPGGCIVTFNISSPATASGPPAVGAGCKVNGDRQEWQACAPLPDTSSSDDIPFTITSDGDRVTNSTVWAMPEPAVDAFVVSLQHRYASTGLNVTRLYNVTGNVTVDFETVRMPVNTTVRAATVTEAWWWLRNVTSGGCSGIGQACRAVRKADGSGLWFRYVKGLGRQHEAQKG